MLDWIGSLRLEECSPRRVVLSLSRTTSLVGGLLLLGGGVAAAKMWGVWPWSALPPAAIAAAGLLLVSLERRLVFDREAGVMRLEHRTFGITSRTVVPLFHLRAVVVVAQPVAGRGQRYVAYLERRLGGPIYIDEARRCAPLMRMAEAIADVAEVRLEYEAVP